MPTLAAIATDYKKEVTRNGHTLNGLWMVTLVAFASLYFAQSQTIKSLGVSPLLIAMMVGIAYGNTLRRDMPGEWAVGFKFATRQVLRTAIALYGFRLTFGDMAALGWTGAVMDVAVVISTLMVGWVIGTKVLGMDPETTLLCSCGTAICGAAAVLAAEPITGAGHAKTAVAVATVTIFGTIAMFAWPLVYSLLPHGLDPVTFGLLIGASTHEIAQVAAAGTAIDPLVAKIAVAEKMGRVLMLAPVLLVVAMLWRLRAGKSKGAERQSVPWFAIAFVGVVALNSLVPLPRTIITAINDLDTLLLAVAMAALGTETLWTRIKKVGPKPFLLAAILFAWVVTISYMLT
jgi:uncharacterized integral membrane protein (TIGR00698 family)